ncbi:hypothetical protein U1Q18_018115 [Sarracenia purpurea var. burkii]
MRCCIGKRPRTQSPTKSPPPERSETESGEPRNVKHEVLFRVPGCKVQLVEEGEAVEIAAGDFSLVRVSEDGTALATVVKVGDDLQWPLTKDEPVVKLDASNYLFSLSMKDGEVLNYGVSFSSEGGSLGFLDSFLRDNCCFSGSSSSNKNDVNWKEFAPAVEDYNNFLAKAVAGGTGQIIKGIFKCSNAYINQVQKGGQMIQSQAIEEKNTSGGKSNGKKNGGAKKKTNALNKSLKGVRMLSRMTDQMSKMALEGVLIATGSVTSQVVRTSAGKAFIAMVPGQVLLASLDAVNKVLEAAEVAEKQALTATSSAASRMVSQRFGESAGEATEHVLATAGHTASTAWNVFKIRKAVNPASSISTATKVSSASKVVKNATKKKKP